MKLFSLLKNRVSINGNRPLFLRVSLIFSGLSTIENSPKLDPATENSIRQAVRFLEGFAMAMKDLPDRFYINTMGFLIDEFTETLVSLVCKANDISAVAASELLILCNTISERVPKLFTVKKILLKFSLKIFLNFFRIRWKLYVGAGNGCDSKN